ncbi:MAG: hypothetical protein HFI77_00195 [Lachnospiraceae bacterium]|uniref:hypothetical protein n=1 Tax=Roseburia sp. 1XD42-69 TaxID=2320088 RepID=UPI000EA3101F|nr:hypothetical protein [Roseburia sp. 1XD42-69]MCI8874482.1 hypothetical protein [Lachnospiraceae bacterium]RKJ68488.1 hypothetical protein D7Y06_02000 [Roseburia sp. 1XD42-69]
MAFRRSILAMFILCLLCLFPLDVKAGDADKSGNTTTGKTQEQKIKDKSFNKHKTITIREEETFQKAKEYIWISYQPKYDGYLTIQNTNVGNVPANGYLALYNRTKSIVLSSKSISYSGKYSSNKKTSEYWTKNVFGLKKGETYFIRVKAFTPVTLKSSFKKVTDKSGALQSKALNIKKSKTKTGLIPAGGTTPDWYKFTLKKNQKIQLYYNIHTKGSFQISLYSGRRRLAGKVLSTQGAQKMTIARQKTDTKGKRTTHPMEKGTYYIKIEPVNSLSSGYYTLMWK